MIWQITPLPPKKKNTFQSFQTVEPDIIRIIMFKVHAFILVSLVLNVTKADYLPFFDAGFYKSYDTTPLPDMDGIGHMILQKDVSIFFCKSKWVGMNSHQCFCGSYFGGLLLKVNSSECNIDCQGDPELKCGALTTRFEDYYSTRTSTIISLYRQG